MGDQSRLNKAGKKRLNKEDIGMPTNFQHISHVGWDPNHGFDLENVDPNLKKFFHKAGVDEKALQDKDTRDFIYDFIDKHGGVEAALRPRPASASTSTEQAFWCAATSTSSSASSSPTWWTCSATYASDEREIECNRTPLSSFKCPPSPSYKRLALKPHGRNQKRWQPTPRL